MGEMRGSQRKRTNGVIGRDVFFFKQKTAYEITR